MWMLHIGRARHPGPRCPPPGKLAIECVSVRSWLADGDQALESRAGFLAVVQFRHIPARARSVSNELRINSKASSVWAPACQDSITTVVLEIPSVEANSWGRNPRYYSFLGKNVFAFRTRCLSDPSTNNDDMRRAPKVPLGVGEGKGGGTRTQVS